VADLFEQPWPDQLTADFTITIDDGLALLDELGASVGDLDEWCRHASARQELVDTGLGPVVDFVETKGVKAEEVLGVIHRSVLERWCDVIIGGDPRLKTMAPSERNALVERFRELDRALVANASARVVNACTARRPSTTLGAAGIIRREAQKKTRHKAIRTLLSETRDVVLALKPCFMMSPLSVSQYLPPDLTFDVVIFDEASQVRPADAVNCIYRGRQLIVAGDPRQLPPTNFFEAAIDESADEYDDEAPENFESVLDIFLGSGLPPLSLQWHYRSQHESLITFSNYRFYGGQLHTFPGALEHADDVGIALIDSGGVYRRGGARDNPIEATKVVERVLFHRRNHPHLTLGVVAFSSAQESAIVAEMERLAATEPELPELMSSDRLDGFFVKNLENVQGDERDIIIFSIGYGRDEHGKFTEQLGPLGQKGGERRLNVAITRARRRVEVVSSVRAGDFPGTSAMRGIRELQKYLEFAERGIAALATEIQGSERDAESPFEEAVLTYIRSLGYDVVPQVGVAGFRLDMAIRNPSRPGSFMLGIECDGAAYHSSRVARDRDRLRQEILEGLGWRIYRIWGPSWYHDRAGQQAALRATIESCLTTPKPSTAKKPEITKPVIETRAAELDARPRWAVDYTASTWKRQGWTELHLADKAALAAAVERIVADESPVHEDIVRRRIMDAYYVQRMGARIRDALDAAIDVAVKRRSVKRLDSEFLTAPNATVTVRVPNPRQDDVRKVSHIAPVERQEAIRLLVSDGHRVSSADLLIAYARLFGWKRTGAEIESAFESDLWVLTRNGVLQVDETDHVELGPKAPRK
jgi:very-short-patch-repair endonuclease